MLSALALSIAVPSEPQLAFVARYYGDGKQKSRFEIYVSDINAIARRKLTTTEEPNQVAWVGRGRLAWTTNTGVWTSRLDRWDPKKVLTSKGYFGFVESKSRVTPPGEPMIHIEDKPKYQIDRTGKLIAPRSYGLVGRVVIDQEKESTITSPIDPLAKFSFVPFEGFTYMFNGAKQEFENGVTRAWTADKKLFLQTWAHDSTTGSVSGLYISEEGSRVKTVFNDANSFDFWHPRSAYAYTTIRTLAKSGNKQLWTSQLVYGDWPSGRKKAIVKGAVWVSNASIRPDMPPRRR